MNGALCREVRLRELTAEDHAFLVEDAGALLPAHWTTEALRRCAVQADGAPLTADAIRSLTVGDREALLLHLRRLTSGDRLQCVLSCPSAECGEKLDLELRVADLLVPAGDARQDRYETRVDDADTACRVWFRLPTGLDQEAVAGLARVDLNAAVQDLLRRCVESVVSADGTEMPDLPDSVCRELPRLMSELDPQAETALQVTCQSCGGAFHVVFDAASYFFQELKAGMRHLYQEVHLLAYHYHWSLREILGMKARVRRRYLQLLEEELGAGAGV
ncbi:MAG TPA: hypothetical protein VNY05_14925 [Candidatus Acidoferrales bacterium]|nr:hypothetical protein [Candidatus Acidoferrales bacterium]